MLPKSYQDFFGLWECGKFPTDDICFSFLRELYKVFNGMQGFQALQVLQVSKG
jgi:hypothetical protein